MKRLLLGIFIVLLLCAGCGKGTGKLGKSTPEKLFKMSAAELSELSSSKFKEILNEDGALYEVEYDTCYVKTPDKFMGYDCLYAAEEMGKEGWFDENGSRLIFCLDLGTGDEYKEDRKKIEGYFEKNQAKGVNAIKIESDEGTGYLYTLELTEADKCFKKRIDTEWSDLTEDEFNHLKYTCQYYFDSDEAEELTKENFGDKFKQVLSEKGYKIYKMAGVVYQLASDIYEDKLVAGFDGTCCEINLGYTIFTDSGYIQYGTGLGYDTIDGKTIDLSSIDQKLKSVASEDQLYEYYMMKEHGFDAETGKTYEDKQAFQYWCLRELEWDDDTGELVDLSDYFKSAKVYMAAEKNYNVDTGKDFASQEELARWLYKNIKGNDQDKRMWVLGKTGYDAEAGKAIDKEVADALYTYYGYLVENEWLDWCNGLKLIYIDDNNIPELLLFTTGNWACFDLRTYHDGTIVPLTNWAECSYFDHENLFSASGRVDVDHYQEDVYQLKDGQLVSLFTGVTILEETTKYEIDGQAVSEAEYNTAFKTAFQIDGKEPIDFWDGPDFSDDLMTAYYDSLLPIERSEQSVPETASSETQALAQPSGEYILPDSDIRYMTYHDLKELDADTLRIAKNEIFARHGRIFKDEKLSEYFNSKSWYNGTISPDDFSDAVFNDFENGNIRIIQFLQDDAPDGDYDCDAADYKYFKIDSGVLTVCASAPGWVGGYALSLPMADDCIWSYGGYEERWQQPYTGGEAGLLSIIAAERTRYQESPDHFDSPAGISVRVKGGVIVKIWEWSP